MNYFERLLRRALLRPAAQPGVPLADPFEEVAEWPLDAAAGKPAIVRGTTSTAESPPAVAAMPKADAPVPPNAIGPIPYAPAPIPLAASRPPPANAEAPLAAMFAVADVRSPAAPPPPPTHVPAAPASPPMPSQELADAFMRNLGVLTPERRVPRIEPALETPADFVPATPAAQPAHQAAQQVLPAVEPAPRIEATEPAAAAPTTRAEPDSIERPRERRSSAPPASPPRAIVVVPSSGATAADRSSGCGAPHFGLGQL